MTQNSSEIFQLKRMLPDPIIDLISVRLSDATHRNIKSAEAICVEIASEMKKYFRPKDMLKFNFFWNM